jgi:DNA-binding transcriptional MerR regulator
VDIHGRMDILCEIKETTGWSLAEITKFAKEHTEDEVHEMASEKTFHMLCEKKDKLQEEIARLQEEEMGIFDELDKLLAKYGYIPMPDCDGPDDY